MSIILHVTFSAGTRGYPDGTAKHMLCETTEDLDKLAEMFAPERTPEERLWKPTSGASATVAIPGGADALLLGVPVYVGACPCPPNGAVCACGHSEAMHQTHRGGMGICTSPDPACVCVQYDGPPFRRPALAPHRNPSGG